MGLRKDSNIGRHYFLYRNDKLTLFFEGVFPKPSITNPEGYEDWKFVWHNTNESMTRLDYEVDRSKRDDNRARALLRYHILMQGLG